MRPLLLTLVLAIAGAAPAGRAFGFAIPAASGPVVDEARLLDVSAGSPILTLERTVYDQSGRVVEIGHTHYRPDRYTIEFTLVEK